MFEWHPIGRLPENENHTLNIASLSTTFFCGFQDGCDIHPAYVINFLRSHIAIKRPVLSTKVALSHFWFQCNGALLRIIRYDFQTLSETKVLRMICRIILRVDV